MTATRRDAHGKGAAREADHRPVRHQLDTVETHISLLFFTPDRVYKLLKPIRTAFLDHTSTAARCAAIDAELLLNRRMANDVYLGTADVVERGSLVDRLLVMRRLPDERCLAALIDDPSFDDHLRHIAHRVAAFHSRLPPIFDAVPLATSSGLRAFWDSSLADIAPAAGTVIPVDDFAEVGELVAGYLDHHHDLFERRRDEGWVRDGHGDLTADDIYILADGPRILDCLAFDTRYRTGDVLGDIAFLVMDVERLAGDRAARRLLGWYAEFTGEHHPTSLAHHYVAYRAHVRAKVAVLRHQQGDECSAAVAASYHTLALAHLRQARATVVLVGGGPGTGKSTLAGQLAGALDWVVLDSDELRKDLHHIDHDDHRVELHPDLYSAGATAATYRQLVDHAGAVLAAGESVILDATWADAEHRALARRAAERFGARFIELDCHSDAALAEARLAERRRLQHDASDATPRLVRLHAELRQPWPSSHPIDTSGRLDTVVERALAVVEGA